MPNVPHRSTQDKAKQLRKTIDDSVESLAKAVDAVRASETFRRYLEVQARFHNYSWRNTMLIFMQRPEATRVAGYRSWQKLGRQVCKGEHGIMILAPMTGKRDADSGPDADSADENGKVSFTFFRPVHVFDVAQTDGEALPTVDVPTVDVLADDLLAKLVRVAEHRKIEVVFGQFRPGLFGVSKHGSVDIADQHATGQQAKTLAHELAHEALHWEDRGQFTRNVAELEAESVAYVVCKHFGLDVEVRASRYIALWGGDAKALRESLDRIAKTARSIIDDAASIADRKAVA